MPVRSRSVPSRPSAFVEARRFVRDTAGAAVPSSLIDDAVLLASELVTNAVRHADGSPDDPIEITVSIDERALAVSVRDRGVGFEPEEPPVRSDQGGWGLNLVRSLSSRWGVTPREPGTEVWFELELHGSRLD